MEHVYSKLENQLGANEKMIHTKKVCKYTLGTKTVDLKFFDNLPFS